MESPQRPQKQCHIDGSVEGGGELRARLPSIEDHAFIENRTSQPDAGVDAALGDAFTSQVIRVRDREKVMCVNDMKQRGGVGG